MNAAIRVRLALALAFIGLAVAGAVLAPTQVPVVAVRASHIAPVPTAASAPASSANESLRTDI